MIHIKFGFSDGDKNMLEEYYNNYDEEGRMKRDNVHAVEYNTTMHFLKNTCP